MTANFFKKSLIKNANLLGKGLIENLGSGVINRRNGCGTTPSMTKELSQITQVTLRKNTTIFI
ncbi:MAG: hypothetical protein ACOX7Y_05400 [Methanosarcina sp.]